MTLAFDDVTEVDPVLVPYPTLHAIGLGPQLAELERICADAAKGKHSGGSILEHGSEHHWLKAANHLTRDGTLDSRDEETNARHLIHAAARLLMAAACLDADDAAVKQSLTAAARRDAEGEITGTSNVGRVFRTQQLIIKSLHEHLDKFEQEER